MKEGNQIKKQKEWTCPFTEKDIKKIYPSYDHKKFLFWLNHPIVNQSLGCMFGSWIGDALGAYLEFSTKINEDLVNEAMTMRKGGPFGIREGQVTDDSQMSFHLLQGLCLYDPHKPLESQRLKLLHQIAKGYIAWKRSKPFDIGITCRNGIKILEEEIDQKWFGSSPQKEMQRVRTRLNEINKKSESNGSLMRITPLVFFTSMIMQQEKSIGQIQKLIEEEVQLIHPSDVIVKSSVQWVKTLYTICIRKTNETLEKSYYGAVSEAKKFSKEWAQEIDADESMDATTHQGWAKIAWSYGMRQLKTAIKIYKQNPNYSFDSFYYKNVIQKILLRGGDTDTNAAIVGGMIGAIIGFKNLPEDYLKKLFDLNYSDKSKQMLHDRPSFYEPRYVFVQMYQFLEKIHDAKEKKVHSKM